MVPQGGNTGLVGKLDEKFLRFTIIIVNLEIEKVT